MGTGILLFTHELNLISKILPVALNFGKEFEVSSKIKKASFPAPGFFH